METATMKRHTKASVLKLAKKLHGKNAFVREYPKAPDAAQKQIMREQRAAMVAERDELKATLGSDKAALANLMRAARFVVDVGGDEPSIPQLREILEGCEANAAKLERYNELHRLVREMPLHSFRCEALVYKCDYGLPMNVVLASADTWDELAAKLEAKAAT